MEVNYCIYINCLPQLPLQLNTLQWFSNAGRGKGACFFQLILGWGEETHVSKNFNAVGESFLNREPKGVGVANSGGYAGVAGKRNYCFPVISHPFIAVRPGALDGQKGTYLFLVISFHMKTIVSILVSHTLNRECQVAAVTLSAFQANPSICKRRVVIYACDQYPQSKRWEVL